MAESMSLDQALAYLQGKGFLHFDDDERGIGLWSPHNPMPMPVLRTLFKHRAQLLDRMKEGQASVCPNCDLHRRYWKYKGGKFICEICERIEVRMNRQDENKSA